MLICKNCASLSTLSSIPLATPSPHPSLSLLNPMSVATILATSSLVSLSVMPLLLPDVVAAAAAAAVAGVEEEEEWVWPTERSAESSSACSRARISLKVSSLSSEPPGRGVVNDVKLVPAELVVLLDESLDPVLEWDLTPLESE